MRATIHDPRAGKFCQAAIGENFISHGLFGSWFGGTKEFTHGAQGNHFLSQASGAG
jgi:hypothetical protein